MTFDEFLERLARLRVDRANGGPRPYKPVLVAATVLLVHKRKITDPRVFLDGGLKSSFDQLLARLCPSMPPGRDVRYPFRHLANDGVWNLVPRDGDGRLLDGALQVGVKARHVLRHVACAELDAGVFYRLSSSFEARFRVLQLLGDRYFERDRAWELLRLLGPDDEARPSRVAEGGRVSERAFEEYLERHWARTPFARDGVELARRETVGLPARQVLTPVNSIDLLGYRRADRTFWVFELKRGRPADRVVGQVSRYLGWLLEERRSRGEGAVGVVLGQGADPKLRAAVRANDRLSLWTWDEDFEIRRAA